MNQHDLFVSSEHVTPNAAALLASHHLAAHRRRRSNVDARSASAAALNFVQNGQRGTSTLKAQNLNKNHVIDQLINQHIHRVWFWKIKQLLSTSPQA